MNRQAVEVLLVIHALGEASDYFVDCLDDSGTPRRDANLFQRLKKSGSFSRGQA